MKLNGKAISHSPFTPSLTHLDAVVSPDGARLAVLGVGLPEHHTPGLDYALALPAHRYHRAGVHVSEKFRLKATLL